MALNLDLSTKFGARVERRLREESVIWLTTVRADGTPEPSPVWFYWDGQSLLTYSLPDTARVKNIRRNPKVSLNFDGNGSGGNIIVLTGQATIESTTPPEEPSSAYAEKYTENLKRMGRTLPEFVKRYSTTLRVTPTNLRGH